LAAVRSLLGPCPSITRLRVAVVVAQPDRRAPEVSATYNKRKRSIYKEKKSAALFGIRHEGNYSERMNAREYEIE
jgi:hypothetical protein